VVLVTTPQAAAVEVARKGAVMFQRLKVPIIGVVQNMSTVVCPKCQHSLTLYGHGTEALTSELGNYNILMFVWSITVNAFSKMFKFD
jgi:ATP-binding protein involved in chromosome partitioning